MVRLSDGWKVEHSFRCLLAIWVFFFCDFCISNFCPFFHWVFIFFLLIRRRPNLKALTLRQISWVYINFCLWQKLSVTRGLEVVTGQCWVLFSKYQIMEEKMEKRRIFTVVFWIWWTMSWYQISRECIALLLCLAFFFNKHLLLCLERTLILWFLLF